MLKNWQLLRMREAQVYFLRGYSFVLNVLILFLELNRFLYIFVGLLLFVYTLDILIDDFSFDCFHVKNSN